jgi:predicted nucleic acid-binding protein
MSPRHLIDANVLLDLATEDPRWAQWSMAALAHAIDHGGAAINPLIYAEVSAGFAAIESVEQHLPPALFTRLDLPYEASFLAGKAFVAYRRRGGSRHSPLPDFFIGAHAAVAGLVLVTRDTARYRTYFPTLSLVAPDTHFTADAPGPR